MTTAPGPTRLFSTGRSSITENPADIDTDGDTLTDGSEVNEHLSDPLSLRVHIGILDIGQQSE